MGFRFRLETVLRHRRREMEDRAREVAIVERRIDHARQTRRHLEEELAACRDRPADEPGSRLHVGDLMAKSAWLSMVGGRLREAEATIAELEARRDLLRAELEESWRRCEVLEKLKARRKTECDRGANRRETLELDEIGSVRHAQESPA